MRLATTRGRKEGPGITIIPAPTHQVFAARIGSHREAVTREFSRLEHEKVLEGGWHSGRRWIRIIDVQRLNAFDP